MLSLSRENSSAATVTTEEPVIAEPALLFTLPNGKSIADYIKEMAQKSIIQTTNSDGSAIPTVSFYREKEDIKQEQNGFLKGELKSEIAYTIDASDQDTLYKDAGRGNNYQCGNGACIINNYMMLTGHLYPGDSTTYSTGMRLTITSMLGASIDNKGMKSLPQAIMNGAKLIIATPISDTVVSSDCDYAMRRNNDRNETPFGNCVGRRTAKFVITQDSTACEVEYQLDYLSNSLDPEIIPFDVKISCQVNFRDGLWHLDPNSYRFSGKDAELAKRICREGKVSNRDNQQLVSRIRPARDSLVATIVYPKLSYLSGTLIPELAGIEKEIRDAIPESTNPEVIQKIGEILVRLENNRIKLYKLSAAFDEKHLHDDSTTALFKTDLAQYKKEANKIINDSIQHLKTNKIVDTHTISAPAALKREIIIKVAVVAAATLLCIAALAAAIIATGGLATIPLAGTAIASTLSGAFSLQAIGVTIGATTTAFLVCTHAGLGLGFGVYYAAKALGNFVNSLFSTTSASEQVKAYKEKFNGIISAHKLSPKQDATTSETDIRSEESPDPDQAPNAVTMGTTETAIFSLSGNRAYDSADQKNDRKATCQDSSDNQSPGR